MTLATFWRQATAGTSYWRCEVPARHLPGKVCSLEHADVQPDEHGEPFFPRQEGVAIWQFPHNATRATLIAAMQEEGIPCFVEVDDNYLVPAPPIPGRTSGWKFDFDRRKERVREEIGGEVVEYVLASDDPSHKAHRETVKWADGVICSTPRLADYYHRINENVHVCPNSVDPDDWDFFHERPNDGILRIGYAASDSHHHDATLVRDALEWASRQKDVEVVLMGLNPGWKFEYRHLPWTDTLEQYRRSLFQLDVGLCPLRPGVWADCKSDVKALEYSMAGAASIVSPVEPYYPWYDRTLTAKDSKEFLKAVKWCVANRDEVRELAREGRKYVLNERTIDLSIEFWREAIR